MEVAGSKHVIQPNGGDETVVTQVVQRQTEQNQRWVAQQERHKAVITAVVNKTARMRKESKSRRHRDLQGTMIDDAVEALTAFQDVEWPPREPIVAPAAPEWMKVESATPCEDLNSFIERHSPAKEQQAAQTDETAGVGTKSNMGNRKNDGAGNDEATEVTDVSESDDIATNGKAGHVLQADTPMPRVTPTLNGFEKQYSVAKLTTSPMSKSSSSRPLNPIHAAAVQKVKNLLDQKIQTQKQEPMHSAVIAALEAYCLIMRSLSKTPKMCETALECVILLATNGYISGEAGIKDKPKEAQAKSLNDNSSKTKKKREADEAPLTLLDYVIESICKCSESSSELVHIAMAKALTSLISSRKCGVHEAALLVSVRSTFHVYLVAKPQNAKDLARASLLDMLKAVFTRMESYDAVARSNLRRLLDSAKKSNETTCDDDQLDSYDLANMFSSQYHTDAYLLFRALCKLSAKTLPEEDPKNKLSIPFSITTAADPLALNSKVLSLELILTVFDNRGESFRKNEKFIYAVQNYLCVSLLKNCMSVHTDVAYLSLKLFIVLMYNFKAHLKSEIEVFMANIFLRVLESPNSSYDQKALVLEALRTLCSDPIMLTQLFLNYDCDFDAVDLYKSIVFNLARVSTKHPNTQQDAALSQTGLEVLVVILRAFLKILNLPGGNDDIDDSSSILRSRRTINLDIALAVTSDKAVRRKDDGTETESESDDGSMYSLDVKTISEKKEDCEGVAGKIVDAFDRKRAVQQNFENGIIKFTLSLKGGLHYFIENGFLKLDAREVASFLLKHQDRLDKTQIGEVLGKEPDASFIKDKNADPEFGGEGFFVRILHHYVYALDFTGMSFDEAIRSFLSGFRLPGEAQKIDRIMEKFAELYTRQNADVFASADTAFILAFSVIMLNTDLHNPNIKPEKRMTVESFIRNNRGISVDGGDLPDAFLEGIFRRIESKPFTLKEDDDAREKEKRLSMRDTFFALQERNFFGTSAEERKREKFKKEQEEIMSASEQLFKRRPKGLGKSLSSDDRIHHSQMTESVSPVDVVKPMFEVTWGPLIGTLSHVLETAEDHGVINLCLNGFVYSVRIAANSNMSLARETFVNALTKFTTLGSIKEMKFKNIESIQTLLSIAIMDGEYLGDSWGAVLQCISHLGRLQNMGSGGVDDEKFFIGEDGVPRDESKSFFRIQSKADVERETETQNAQAVLAAVNEILIDKVFSSTVNLSAPSMAQFVEQLINVSAAEISGDLKKGVGVQGRSTTQNSAFPLSNHSSRNGQGPRIFSLQKLVEVADYNMDARPRIAWTQMWELMARHFAAIGCHKNAMVSMYAIDALRQLSFKFLQKPELYDFNFQRVFLRPFLLIMESPISREDIRELILRCVDNMIRTLSCNLRSGWKIFFQIITLSAVDPCEKNSTLGLAILQRLLDEHLEELCHRYAIDEYNNGDIGEQLAPEALTLIQRKVRNANAEDFVDLCRASLSFVEIEAVKRPLPVGLSMRALCHTACYADIIAEQKVLPPVISQAVDPEGSFYSYEDLHGIESEEMVLWKPIFDGLSAGIASRSLSSSGGLGCLVQRGSAITLRAILLRHGKRFSVPQWNAIFKQVILPSLQRAAESDRSPVTYITSESPSVSSLDFVADSLPLPPLPDAESLMKFAAKAQSDECAPKRPLGPAELLVEASFADLRHGGDGDLSRVSGFPRRRGKSSASEQPFPDSWVATTAALALGIITDIFNAFVLDLGDEGRNVLWPSILGQYKLWILGPPDLLDSVNNSDDVSILEDSHLDPLWRPGEALARIGCKELCRTPNILSEKRNNLPPGEVKLWWELICKDVSSVLLKNVTLNRAILTELVDSKLEVIGRHRLSEPPSKNLTSKVVTPYGLGEVLKRRRDYNDHQMWEVALDWGATMYGPEPEDFGKDDDTSYEAESDEDNLNVEADENSGKNYDAPKHPPTSASLADVLEHYVPALKIRCVVAHIVQQYIAHTSSLFVECSNDSGVQSLLSALDASRLMAIEANGNVDVAHAFKEFVRREWGDSVEEVEAALAAAKCSRDLNQRKNEVFFLAQEAGANRALIEILSRLHVEKNNKAYESLLFERIADILTHFLQSEKNDRHMIDPNIWRKPSESCGDIPLYCTSFANVVVSILRTVMQLSREQFHKRKNDLYPFLCALVKVQSDEIRSLVSDIFSSKVSSLLAVDMTQFEEFS